jgi:hypothetical protein
MPFVGKPQEEPTHVSLCGHPVIEQCNLVWSPPDEALPGNQQAQAKVSPKLLNPNPSSSLSDQYAQNLLLS